MENSKNIEECTHCNGSGYITTDKINGICPSCMGFGAEIGCACLDGQEHIIETSHCPYCVNGFVEKNL